MSRRAQVPSNIVTRAGAARNIVEEESIVVDEQSSVVSEESSFLGFSQLIQLPQFTSTPIVQRNATMDSTVIQIDPMFNGMQGDMDLTEYPSPPGPNFLRGVQGAVPAQGVYVDGNNIPGYHDIQHSLPLNQPNVPPQQAQVQYSLPLDQSNVTLHQSQMQHSIPMNQTDVQLQQAAMQQSFF